jgi:UPF0042 nucleotide-binding protein
MNLIIVSGLSGSGKSIALQALEDFGFYCIDNLPAGLLPHFVQQLQQTSTDDKQTAAVGIDVRNRLFLDALPATLEELKSSGINYKIIFLEANDSILIQRYKESRRRHPMTDQHTSLLEGIELERKLLEPLSENADLRIETAHTTPKQLRNKIRDFIGSDSDTPITLLFESFGFKRGTPLDADFVFDVRCLPNPYWQPELREYSGLDDQIISFMDDHEEVSEMATEIQNFLLKWLPNFIEEPRSYLTIAIGCTGGQHRSVYLAKRIGSFFSSQGYRTQIRHRELS